MFSRELALEGITYNSQGEARLRREVDYVA
jgi:hypothetical protein